MRFDFWRSEKRNIQDPKKAVSAQDFATWLFGGSFESASGFVVNTDTALKVPAVWAAVNFLSGSIAGLPLHVYRKTKDGRERATGVLSTLLHDAPNDEQSSFEWRKSLFESVFTVGRGLSFIERAATGAVVNIWPMDPTQTTVERKDGRKTYTYRDGARPKTFAASEVIDIPFMLKADGITARGPVSHGCDAIGLAIAATHYGSTFLAGGGVPPFAVTGNFGSGDALKRAADDLMDAVRKAAKERRQALTLPIGLDIKQIGADPEKSQLVELQRFCIEQVARIYSLPPTFLQDLTHGTFTNTEQQGLHLEKHTLKRWVEHFEQELNLKLFGRSSNKTYVEMSMDGFLRGDITSRFNAYAQGIQNGVLKPNEARRLENLPDDPSGDQLMIQGATVPIGTQGDVNVQGNQV